MQIKKVTLTNFRNYAHAEAELWQERNILLGENAQGKSNFIEAIELLAKGRSDRAVSDSDLIRNGAADMNVRLTFEREGREQSLALTFCKTTTHVGAHPSKFTIEKRAQVNGISSSSLRPLSGHLATVSFKNEDLGLLRAGPKFRRDWIDQIIVNLKPAMQERLARYQKAVSQRNRLLKNLFEKGKVTASQQDELKVWDDQLAKHGSLIIRERLDVLKNLLNRGVGFQSTLSDQQEALSAAYQLRNSQSKSEDEDFDRAQDAYSSMRQSANISPELFVYGGPEQPIEAIEIADILLRSYKESRYEEISRRQTLYGPHRDDITFLLSDKQATSFASQGQQRSLVLAMKLAELKLVSDSLSDSPVLLLDDVLAELDLNRQSLLMSLIRTDMQTIITTTHISGFRPEWLEKAAFIYVKDGSLERQRPGSTADDICNAQVDLG